MVQQGDQKTSPTPRWRAWLRLMAAGVGLWVFFAYVDPLLVSLSPAWQRYNQVQEERGLHSGALYYTNLPVWPESEAATRAAVRVAMERREASR